MSRRSSALVIGGLVAAGLGVSVLALADGFDPRAPKSVVVGSPGGPSPVGRVGPRRNGKSPNSLPKRRIHVAWKKATGAPVEGPVLVEDGRVVVVGARGDVVTLGPDGDERTRAATGVSAPGPAALLADGTTVFVSAAGEVVGAQGKSKRFGVRLGPSGAGKVSPLPLADGGFVAAAGADLALFDADGGIRARAQAPEPLVGALLSHGGRVVGAGRSGAVLAWSPGGEVVRVGSFRAPIDGPMALDDGGRLVAVTDQNQITEVELGRSAVSTRASAAPGSLYLGPVALGPTGTALLGSTFGVSYLVLLDRSSTETRIAIGTAPPTTPTLLPDGGAPPVVIPPHAGVLIDAQGTVAFVTPEGVVGVASRDSGVSTLGESACARGGARVASHPGLSPAEAGAFYVACESGTVVKVAGE